MADIVTPQLGESVSEATVSKWAKKAGDAVKKDEVLVELETDKVSLEVASPADGVLGEITAAEGATVTPGARLGVVSAGAAGATNAAAPGQEPTRAAGKGTVAAAKAPSGEEQPEPIKGQPAPTPSAPVTDTSAPSQAAQAPAPAAPSPPAASAPSGGGVEVTVPTMGESVTEGTIAAWSKKAGDRVARDEVLVEIETDKVAVEVSAPADGVLSEILAEAGETVKPNQVIARIGGAAAGAGQARQQPSGAGEQTPANQPPAAQKGEPPGAGGGAGGQAMPLSPSVQRIVSETGIDPSRIAGTGKDGRVTKGDALQASQAPAFPAQSAPVQSAPAQSAPAQSAPVQSAPVQAPPPAAAPPAPPSVPRLDQPREERVRMTRLRQTIARRLKEAQNTAAMLTTFNEVDMSTVMALRTQYKDVFEKRHGVKLGFMSVFTRAVVAALKEVPAVNAEIDGQDLIYKNHYDIGVAVGTDKGLVVPVVRDADRLTLAGIEKAIGDLGRKARDGKLAIEDMQGGTFTITNGGIYGSLMSTPILNLPQAGVLGMHNIVQRPVAVDGKVEIRPMMYLALSYDHRIVDGKEAVTFLVAVKNAVEDPQRLLLDL